MIALAPSIRTFFSSGIENLILPSDPTPEGIEWNRVVNKASFLGIPSLEQSEVLITLTPQLMSKPTPPGEITPLSIRVAPTPPIGKPYPQ